MCEKVFKVVSLFSGIGGFEVGLKKSNLDFEVVFSSEIDKQAQISYNANFPKNNLHGDITQIDSSDIPDHDILCAGFPCQTFSIAGKQHGFSDTRGTLFFDVARILKDKKPKIVLLENVKNLISHDKSKTINIILLALNELGYTTDFTVINSNEAGLPQNRDRTYIFAVYDHIAEKYEPDVRNKKVSDLKKKLNNNNYFKGFNFFNNVKYSNKQRYIKDILLEKCDEKYYIDSADLEDYLKTVLYKNNIHTRNRIIKLFDLPKELYNDLERQRRVYSINGISPTVLARSDSTKIIVKEGNVQKIRKFSPEENFLVQGFDKRFIKQIRNTGISDTQMYKQSGNAVSPPVVSEIINYAMEVLCLDEE